MLPIRPALFVSMAYALSTSQLEAILHWPEPTINTSSCCTNATGATAFSLIYGYPLIAYLNYTQTFFDKDGIITNSIVASEGLATPQNTSVHHPNPDCTFSNAVIDLSHHSVLMEIPEFHDNRFWAFSFFDPYGDNFATLSVELDSKPGKYLIRRADDVREEWGIQLANSSSPYAGFVNFPSTYGLMLARILALNDTTDIPVAEAYANAVNMTEIPMNVTNQFVASKAPALTQKMLDVNNITSPTAQVLTLLSRFGYYDEPIVKVDRYRVGALIEESGVDFFASEFKPQSDANYTAATRSAIKTVALLSTQDSSKQELSNGWYVQNPEIAGIFYTDYSERAGAANQGYIGDTSNININPGYKGYSTSSLPHDKAYLLTFYGHVPVIPEFGGFWSVTIYLDDGNLVPNSINRYTLGNRDELQYPDGTQVYIKAPNNGTAIGTLAASEVDSNKTFQLLLQAQAPPANWTSNWLPTPANGTASQFKMRVYAPQEAAKNGTYRYPTVQMVDAITS